MYSQSKARSARHKNRQRQSGEFQALQQSRGQQDEVVVQAQPPPQPPAVSSPYQPCKVLKETVFSSEIHSIEYNR